MKKPDFLKITQTKTQTTTQYNFFGFKKNDFG